METRLKWLGVFALAAAAFAGYNPPSSSGSATINSSTVSFTAAQLQNAQAVPLVLVAAPAMGKLIVPITTAYKYTFGTKPYSATGLFPALGVTGIANGGFAINSGSSETGFDAYSTLQGDSLTAQPLQLIPLDGSFMSIANNLGAILTSSLGAAHGSAYLANDTGTLTCGSADATYTVNTVSMGAVVTYTISGAGTAYGPTTGCATAATSGVGTGLTINILTTAIGDGTLTATTLYTIQ